jgi:metal-dependent hydrolase (beta-lactamase superfamily II)
MESMQMIFPILRRGLAFTLVVVLVPAATLAAEPNNGKQPTVTFLYGDRSSTEGIEGLKRAWGMTTVTRIGGKTIMFNTGADDVALKNNMKVLGIGATDIIVLSHRHWEMWQSTGMIIEQNPDVVVYAPSDLMPAIKSKHPGWLKQIKTLDEETLEILPGVLLLKTHSKPRRGGPTGVEELHLILKTDQGIAIGQGCGHTGIFAIAQRASKLTGQRPYLIYGGTRLTNTPTKVSRPGFENGFTVPPARHATPEYVQKLADDLRGFGVRKLVATHCTGSKSETILKKKFGDDFITQTLGMTITLPPLQTRK